MATNNAGAAVAAGERQRRDAQPAFVLHTYPFRETSLVVETFTRNYGRVGLVARGARRPKSTLRGLMMAFQPLLLSWAGKSELRTLHKAEWQGGIPQLRGLGLMCGFYLNELLLKFLAREDPHDTLFDLYQDAIAALAHEPEPATVLRRFEKHLLKELGYALILDREADSGRPIDPGKRYTYVIERGPVALDRGADAQVEISGQALIELESDSFVDAATLAQSKLLMRFLVNHYLGNQELHTRQLLREMQQI
ncbi:MAG: DNA repair protein RecO [Betaproteobacteria bacterium]|nr:DNA repair protein RecO [Betaproteobacteria bacterium]